MARTKEDAALARGSKTTLDKIRESKSITKDEMDFDALLKQLEQEGELVDVSTLGEGYHLISGVAEKKKFVGVPFVITDWVVNKGKFGGFVTLKLRTGVPVVFNGEGYFHFIINDGSTGIARQITEWDSQGFSGAIKCLKGLRVSEDYEVKDENDEPILDPKTNLPIKGTTFYLDTSL